MCHVCGAKLIDVLTKTKQICIYNSSLYCTNFLASQTLATNLASSDIMDQQQNKMVQAHSPKSTQVDNRRKENTDTNQDAQGGLF